MRYFPKTLKGVLRVLCESRADRAESASQGIGLVRKQSPLSVQLVPPGALRILPLDVSRLITFFACYDFQNFLCRWGKS